MDNYQLVQRIQDSYKSCNPSERKILRTILEELSKWGESPTYNDIWLADYREIPVSIDTFLNDDTFLGSATRQGTAIYPAWRTAMRDVFGAGNKYDEVVLTGATRIGKTSTGITMTAYMLYRLMCLKDPQAFFHKKDVSKFSILFFNVTKDLARGVAFREFNDTLKTSPWFNAHGKFSKSEENFYYIPDGNKIIIDYGSDASHGLGKQVFCVVGSTKILTDAGFISISELAGSSAMVGQRSPDGDIQYSDAEIVLTKYVQDTIQIELEDGSIIEGTPDHLIQLTDGSYKKLGDITKSDDILTLDLNIDTVTRVCESAKKIRMIELFQHSKPIPVYDVVNVEPYHNFIVKGEKDTAMVAHNCGFMDEMAFAKAGIKDVNKAKAHMKSLYDTISTRIKGTFRQNGEVYGKLFAISSKNSDSDFMEYYIETQRQAGNGEHMYVFDKPQWEVLPDSMFSSEKFYIAVGNKNQRGFVVPDEQANDESLKDLKNQGFQILEAPIDVRPSFKADFDIALRDIAGISVPGTLSFITKTAVDSCVNTHRRNPFYNTVLTIGTKDVLTIEEFFHVEATDAAIRRCPIFIHLDLSLNDDKSGISGVAISGRKDIQDANGKTVSVPTFTHVFSVDLKAPRGDSIPYNKVVTFICWLRRQGFSIVGISRDQFQSEYVGQQLEAQGFSVNKLSLDRTPDGYVAFRSVLLEERIDLLPCEELEDELIHLQRDSFSGKVDHPVGGSKDISDSIAGAVWNAILQNPGVPIEGKTTASVMKHVNIPTRVRSGGHGSQLPAMNLGRSKIYSPRVGPRRR